MRTNISFCRALNLTNIRHLRIKILAFGVIIVCKNFGVIEILLDHILVFFIWIESSLIHREGTEELIFHDGCFLMPPLVLLLFALRNTLLCTNIKIVTALLLRLGKGKVTIFICFIAHLIICMV